MKNKYFYLELMSISKLRGIFNVDKGGSYSNEYEVNLSFDSIKNAEILTRLQYYGFSMTPGDGAFENTMFLCDEASLPGTFTATQEVDGVYAGRLIQYPHAKLYNDMRLSFIQTNQLNPSKFFEAWMGGMFPEQSMNNEGGEIIPEEREKRRAVTNTVGLRYYDEMVCPKMTVTKSYKDRTGPSGSNSCYYDMINVYPYNIESVPLAYGASTLNKLRVSFRYEKHVVIFYDTKGAEF